MRKSEIGSSSHASTRTENRLNFWKNDSLDTMALKTAQGIGRHALGYGWLCTCAWQLVFDLQGRTSNSCRNFAKTRCLIAGWRTLKGVTNGPTNTNVTDTAEQAHAAHFVLDTKKIRPRKSLTTCLTPRLQEARTETGSCAVVPNKYPAFQPQGDTKVVQQGLYQSCRAVGAHEVIVESPRHVASLSQLSDEEVALLFQAYRDRILASRQDNTFRYALVFKNVGPQAGASLEHSHSQLVATPMVPTEVARELAAAERLFQQQNACFFCSVIADDRKHGERLVAETSRYIAICPYASRMPYEMWILPRVHASHFEGQDDSELEESGTIPEKNDPEIGVFARTSCL